MSEKRTLWVNAREASKILGISRASLHKITAAENLQGHILGAGINSGLFFVRAEVEKLRDERAAINPRNRRGGNRKRRKDALH